MDVALSDLLTCPRCGPTHGLVLLPHAVADRRVESGVLGCANCRERYPIEDGVADLRVSGSAGVGPAKGDGPWPAEEEGEDAAVRLAGLMGLAEARGAVLVAGPAVDHAEALAALVEGIEVVAVGLPDANPLAPAPGVSRMRAGPELPFRGGSLRGVTLTGGWAALLEEGARVLGREGRLVVAPAPPEAGERLVAAGLSVVGSESDVVVAARRS